VHLAFEATLMSCCLSIRALTRVYACVTRDPPCIPLHLRIALLAYQARSMHPHRVHHRARLMRVFILQHAGCGTNAADSHGLAIHNSAPRNLSPSISRQTPSRPVQPWGSVIDNVAASGIRETKERGEREEGSPLRILNCISILG